MGPSGSEFGNRGTLDPPRVRNDGSRLGVHNNALVANRLYPPAADGRQLIKVHMPQKQMAIIE
jgi:hypothetical protein